jgi:EAL domain-containing protein (putative c-di-GMP-specific phosphodiesterase class I)
VVASADDTGLLDVLENLVLTTACRDVCELRAERGLGHVAVHVNVAAQRTCEVELLTTVRQELHRYGLPGSALVIELTESTRVPDLRAAVAVLSTLRGDGVRLALDDFGSGFSGLSYLMELPVDIVKLDRSLIVAPPGSRAAAIARAAALLTLGLGLELIAEGVETPEQTDGLIELGCRLGQGFRYARPQPMNDVRVWINAGS